MKKQIKKTAYWIKDCNCSVSPWKIPLNKDKDDEYFPNYIKQQLVIKPNQKEAPYKKEYS
jgi:hypothetical protein